MELYLPPLKRKPRPKINWSGEMISQLIKLFPFTFNRELAKQLNVSMRSLIRKARELHIEKETGFLDKNRNLITAMAVKAHPEHPHKGDSTWSIPNSEHTRFKKGHIPPVLSPKIKENAVIKRNKTMKRNRLRIKYGLPSLTKKRLRE